MKVTNRKSSILNRKFTFASYIFVLLLSLFLVSSFGASTISCSGGATGGLGDGGGGGGGEGGGAAGGGGGGDDDDDSGGGTELMPPVSIPAPSVIKGENTLVAAADAEGNVPVVLFDGAIPEDSTEGHHMLVVSNEEVDIAAGGIVMRTTRDSRLASFQSSIFNFQSSMIPIAHATSITVPPPVDEVCSTEGVTCCAITDASPFECFHPGTNDDTLNIYIMDTRIPVTISDAHVENPNPQVLWMREPVKDVIKGPTIGTERTDSDVVLALTSDKVVSVNNMGRVLSDRWAPGDERDFQVIGELEDNYQHPGIAEGRLADGAKELAFDPSDDKLAFRKSDQIRTDHPDIDTGLGRLLDDPLAPIATASLADTVDYTKLKYSGDNKLRFVRDFNGVTPTEYVYIYNTAADASISLDNIKFMAPGDIPGVGVENTIVFDVDPWETAIVVFNAYEDGEPRGQRIRMANKDILIPSIRLGGETPLSGTYFKDLIIYHPQTLTDQGKALLVDVAGNAVWIISYFIDLAEEAHYIQDSLDAATDAISVGPNPQSVVMSEDKSKAYVVCQDGEEVYELTLKEGGVLKTVAEINDTSNNLKKVINLPDIIPGKALSIKPNEITISPDGHNLLVGTEDLRSAMVVPVSMAVPIEAEPAAEPEPAAEAGDDEDDAAAGAMLGLDVEEAEVTEGPLTLGDDAVEVEADAVEESDESAEPTLAMPASGVDKAYEMDATDITMDKSPPSTDEPVIPAPPTPPERHPAFF